MCCFVLFFCVFFSVGLTFVKNGKQYDLSKVVSVTTWLKLMIPFSINGSANTSSKSEAVTYEEPPHEYNVNCHSDSEH